MQNNERKRIIQNGFNTVARGCYHTSFSLNTETKKRLEQHLDLNPEQHNDGVLINSESLIALGGK